jgi:MFS family permease
LRPPGSKRTLVLICVAAAGWSFGFGLGAPLASLWLRDCGSGDGAIGLNTGVYYLGIAATAVYVPWLIRLWGVGCPALGMILSGLTIAGFPLAGTATGFFALRFLNGIGGAMSLIPLESRVNRDALPHQRARDFGFYAFSVALGWALGNLVGLQMYVTNPRAAFLLGGIVSLSAGMLLFAQLPWPSEPAPEHRDAGKLSLGPDNFLSFGSAWGQGFLEGGMVAFMSVYLLFVGLSEMRVSWVTSGIMIGVILFQVPVAWLADRLGRIRVLLACYAATIAGLCFLYSCRDSTWLTAALFLVGACSGAFYPLGLAILGEKTPASQLARASAWYLGINCCGSLIGPIVTGFAMERYGKASMFTAGAAAVFGVLAIWVALEFVGWRRRSQRAAAEADKDSVLEVREAA